MKTRIFQTVLIICVAIVAHFCFVAKGAGSGDDSLSRELKRDYYLKQIKNPARDAATKARYLDSIYAIDRIEPGGLLHEATDIYITSGHYAGAIRHLTKVLDTAQSSDTLLYALYNRAFCRQATGNYESALDDIFHINTMDIPDSLKTYRLYSGFLLARIYRVAGDFVKSDSILTGMENIIKEMRIDSAERYSLSYKWLLERASGYLDAKDYTKAMIALKRASGFNMDKESASLVTMGLAELYHHIGEEAMAEDYYRQFIDGSGSSINRMYALNNYCTFLVDGQRYDEAVRLCREQIAYARDNGIRHVEAALYGSLAEALYGKGEYKEAFEMHRQFYALMDSVMYNAGPHLVQDYERNIAIYESGNLPTAGLAGGYGLYIAGGVLIVLLAAAVVILLLRLRREREAARYAAMSEERLLPESAEAAEKEREYLSMTLKLAEMSQILERVCEVASDSDLSDSEKRKEIGMLRANCGNTNFWELFRISFEKIHPRFVKRLNDTHPDLSKGEMRMCSFIVMGLTAKDIATLTNRSVRTVESIKYRLNKKLQPPADTSTETYLRNLM